MAMINRHHGVVLNFFTIFGHSLFIINVNGPSLNNIAVATHTYDVLGKKIGEYNFLKVRFIHIENVRI